MSELLASWVNEFQNTGIGIKTGLESLESGACPFIESKIQLHPETPIGEYTRDAQIVENDEDYCELLTKAAKLTASYSWLAGSVSANTEMKFFSEHKKTINEMYVALVASVKRSSRVVKLSSLELDPDVMEALRNKGPAHFEANYGQMFVGGFIMGGSYVGNLTVTVNNDNEKEQFKTDLAASFAGWGLSINASYGQSTTTTKKVKHYQMKAKESGRGMALKEIVELEGPNALLTNAQTLLNAGGLEKLSAVLYKYSSVPAIIKCLGENQKLNTTLSLLDRNFVDRLCAEVNRLEYIHNEFDSLKERIICSEKEEYLNDCNDQINCIQAAKTKLRNELKNALQNSSYRPEDTKWQELIVSSTYSLYFRQLKTRVDSVVPAAEAYIDGVNFISFCTNNETKNGVQCSNYINNKEVVSKLGFGRFNYQAEMNLLRCTECFHAIDSSKIKNVEFVNCTSEQTVYKYNDSNVSVGKSLVPHSEAMQHIRDKDIIIIKASPLEAAVNSTNPTSIPKMIGTASSYSVTVSTATTTGTYSDEHASVQTAAAQPSEAYEFIAQGDYRIIYSADNPNSSDADKLHVNKKELDRLVVKLNELKIKYPDAVCGVIGVIGYQNSGKSYLINNIFSCNKAAYRGPDDSTIVPFTAGLNMYLARHKATGNIYLLLDMAGYKSGADFQQLQQQIDNLHSKTQQRTDSEEKLLEKLHELMKKRQTQEDYYRRLITLCCSTVSLLLYVTTNLVRASDGFLSHYHDAMNVKLNSSWERSKMIVVYNMVANRADLDGTAAAVDRYNNTTNDNPNHDEVSYDETINSVVYDSFYSQSEGHQKLRLFLVPNMEKTALRNIGYESYRKLIASIHYHFQQRQSGVEHLLLFSETLNLAVEALNSQQLMDWKSLQEKNSLEKCMSAKNAALDVMRQIVTSDKIMSKAVYEAQLCAGEEVYKANAIGMSYRTVLAQLRKECLEIYLSNRQCQHRCNEHALPCIQKQHDETITHSCNTIQQTYACKVEQCHGVVSHKCGEDSNNAKCTFHHELCNRHHVNPMGVNGKLIMLAFQKSIGVLFDDSKIAPHLPCQLPLGHDISLPHIARCCCDCEGSKRCPYHLLPNSENLKPCIKRSSHTKAECRCEDCCPYTCSRTGHNDTINNRCSLPLSSAIHPQHRCMETVLFPCTWELCNYKTEAKCSSQDAGVTKLPCGRTFVEEKKIPHRVENSEWGAHKDLDETFTAPAGFATYVGWEYVAWVAGSFHSGKYGDGRWHQDLVNARAEPGKVTLTKHAEFDGFAVDIKIIWSRSYNHT